VLQGDVKDVLLLDVIPLSFGIETLGGVATKLIEKNTTIPASKSQVFSTAADNQTQVEIHIVQGERPMAADNKSLGRFILDGIAPAPRGMPQVEVTFDIDANGILQVKAKDKATGKEQSIRIESRGSLTEADIKRMQEEAEKFADEDSKKKDLIEKKNMADSVIFSADKELKEHDAKLPEDLKTAIKEKKEALSKVKDGDDAAAIETATTELSSEMMKMYEAIQKAGGTQAGAEQNPQPGDTPSEGNA
jgi:molecular chaperone DnaK